jgi:hypothetical protein
MNTATAKSAPRELSAAPADPAAKALPQPHRELDTLPTRDWFPHRTAALEVINRTLLSGDQFPAGGPLESPPFRRLFSRLRETCALLPQVAPNAAAQETQRHFSDVLRSAFQGPNTQRAVLVDAVYLVVNDPSARSQTVIDLIKNRPFLRNIFQLYQREQVLSAKEFELHYLAGFFDGKDPHIVSTQVPCTLSTKAEKRTRQDRPRAWEDFLIPRDQGDTSQTFTQLRVAVAIGRSTYEFPEARLANEVKTKLRIDSPHLRVTPVPQATLPPEIPRLRQWASTPATVELKAALTRAAGNTISELESRADSLPKTTLQILGEAPLDFPQYNLGERVPVWADPLRGLFEKELTAGYLNLLLLTHPEMLEGHIHASQQPFIPLHYKHIQPLERAHREGMAVAYNEFGLEPEGYTEEDGLPEGLTDNLPQLWMQSIKGFPALGGIVGSSMNWMANGHAYASLALAGSPVFIAADGLQKTREAQMALLERTLELIRKHPIVKNYPWPHHTLSNGERAVDYLVRTAIARVGMTIKPHPPQDAADSVSFFFDQGVRLFRLYDPGTTSLLIQSARAISDVLTRKQAGAPNGEPGGLVVGQVHNMTVARKLSQIRFVAGLIVGIGDGGHCSTASKHGIYPNNLLTLYKVARMGLPIPVVADGGPGLEGIGTVLAVGGSGVMGSGALTGGVFEHPPVGYWFQGADGCYEKLTFGEAAEITKILGGEVLQLSGGIKNLEGIVAARPLRVDQPTHPHNAVDAAFRVAKLVQRFARTSHPDALRLQPEPRLQWGSLEAGKARAPHNREVKPIFIHTHTH